MNYDVKNNFTYHPPNEEQQKVYETLRERAMELAKRYIALCPESRELSIALTNLEQSLFWANASIARNKK